MWNSIIGHSEQISHLRKVIAEKRLAQAYLFSGPEGIGKFSTAQILAQSLHCKSDPCGECPTCARIESGTHPDVVIVAPEKQEIKIEQVRQMQQRLQFHPLEGASKMVIIDRADFMRTEAANACLKVLEEPPAATLFVLIASRPHRILPTIRSRCQTISFQPLATDVVAKFVAEREGVPPADAQKIAALSEGSIGFALACKPEIVNETAADIENVHVTKSNAEVLSVAERWAADAPALHTRLRLLAVRCRDEVIADDRTPKRILNERLATVLEAMDEVESTTFNKQLLCESLLFSFSRHV